MLTIRIDGEWQWNQRDAAGVLNRIVLYANIPTYNGTSAWRFPKGARVWGYEWQSTCRAQNHVVLLNLAILRAATGQVEPMHIDLLNGAECTEHRSPAVLREFSPLAVLEPDDIVFIGGDGWGDPMPDYGAGQMTSLEVQALIRVDPGTVAVPVMSKAA